MSFNQLAHFAIHADDVERAKRFYESVFGWAFEAWGPPEFYLTQSAGVRGALQKRQEPLDGTGMRGFECTIGVEDVDATARSVSEHGGEVTMPRIHIEGVGWLIFFADPEGNRVGAMQYEVPG